MSQSIAFLLLALALVLPVVGAAALRLLAPRLHARLFFGGAALLFAVAIGSVLALSRGNVERLQVGNLTLLLPLAAPPADELNLPPELEDLLQQTPEIPGTGEPDLQTTPTLAATNTATPAPSATLTPTLTPAPTATLTPTAEVTPTATLAPPPPAPPTATPAPAPPAPRTYTVQPGDTLRGIAEQFNVSVADLLRVNNLTPEQADNLRPGAVLTIP